MSRALSLFRPDGCSATPGRWPSNSASGLTGTRGTFQPNHTSVHVERVEGLGGRKQDRVAIAASFITSRGAHGSSAEELPTACGTVSTRLASDVAALQADSGSSGGGR